MAAMRGVIDRMIRWLRGKHRHPLPLNARLLAASNSLHMRRK
jgi:hypothetical protein